jgi:Trk K+ transport system NAD-binding subunit
VGDNRNILASQLAAERLGVRNVVAKINDPIRAEAYTSMGIHTICRTTMMVDALARFMGLAAQPGATDVSAASGHDHPGDDHAPPGPPADAAVAGRTLEA